MPVLQDTYTRDMNPAYPGLPYDLTNLEAYGRLAEASNIPFGVAVIQGTTDNLVRLPDALNVFGGGALINDDAPPDGVLFAFRGITIREHVREQKKNAPLAFPEGQAGDLTYAAPGETLSIATRGRIWVKTSAYEGDVSAFDPVYFRHTVGTAGEDQIGELLNVADTARAQHIPGARWVTSATAGGFAVVELNVIVTANLG